MMPYLIILKVGKFHQPTVSRFGTTRQKPVGLNVSDDISSDNACATADMVLSLAKL